MSVIIPSSAPISVETAEAIAAPAPAVAPVRAATSRYVPALDGIRGLAILLVMLHHAVPEQAEQVLGLGKLSMAARQIGLAGWCGVDLFFVLSGFLITGILYDAKNAERPFRNFYVRRALRIFPLQFAVLFLVFGILTPLKPNNCWATHANRTWLWFSMTNIPIAATGQWLYGAFSHFWSLAVEEQFYLVWPFIVLGLGFGRKTLAGVCLGLLVLSTLLRLGLELHGVNAVSLYVSTPTHMDGLAVGGLLALLARRPGGLLPWRPLLRGVGGVAFVALATIVLWRGGLDASDPVVVGAGYTLLALLFGSLVALAALPGSPAARIVWNRPILRFFGKYSYGMYVFDLLVVSLILHSRVGRMMQFHSYLLWMTVSLVVGVSLTTAIAWLSYNYFERYFLKLKRNFH